MTRKTRKPDDKGGPDGIFGTKHSPKTLSESTISTPKRGKDEIWEWEILVGKLSSDSRSEQMEAVKKLAKNGDEWAVQYLIISMDSDHCKVKDTIAWALGEIGGKRGEKRLIEALADEDAKVRLEALISLEMIESETSATPEIIKLLGDSQPRVRFEATEVLESMGEDALIHLKKGLSDDNPLVVENSRALLKKMTNDLHGETEDGRDGHNNAIAVPKNKITSFEELKDIIACCSMDGVEIVGGGQIFIEACRLGHMDVVSFMLESASEEVSYTACRDGDNAPVPPAIFSSDDEDAVKIYDLEIPITKAGDKRNDALAVAVENGFGGIVSLLLRHGFDLSINCENADGQTPLILAGYNRDLEMISLLLEEDVDVDVKDKYGSTIMNLAVDSGDPAIIRKMMPYVLGLDLEEIGKLAGIEEKNADSQEQKKLNADLARASVMNDVDGARKAIETGADVNSIDELTKQNFETVFTPLMNASYHGHEEIVKLLIESGADVNITDRENYTALSLAVYGGHKGIVQQLLDAKADPNITDWDHIGSKTPLDVAIHKKDKEIEEMLARHGGKRFVILVKEKGFEAESAVKKLRSILDDSVLEPISELVEMVRDM